MARKDPRPDPPSPEQIRDLLQAANLTPYAVGARYAQYGMSANLLTTALRGQRRLSRRTWLLLLILLEEHTRAALPPTRCKI